MRTMYQENIDPNTHNSFRKLLWSGNWFIFNKTLARAVGIELAWFMSDLIDRDNYFYDKNPDYDGWFYSTKESRAEDLGTTEKTLARLMKKAVDENLVETQMMTHAGSPLFAAKQHIKINYVILEVKIQQQIIKEQINRGRQASPERGRQASPERGRYNQTKYNQTNNISLRDKSLRDNECENQSLDSISNDFDSNNNQTDIPSKTKNDEIISRFIPYSKQLANIIQTSKNITITSNQIKTWARSIHQLHKLGISLSRIKTALEWYNDHIGGEYVPVIESGSSFKEKFTKLESAIKREQKRQSVSVPTTNEDPVDETRRKILVSNKGLPEHVHHLPFNHPERLKYMDLSNLEKFDPSKTNWTDDPNAWDGEE